MADQAQEYLQTHHIPELLENITAQIVFQKPSDPRKFMIEYLEQLKQTRDENAPPNILFDEQNCLALFRVFDRSGVGYISLAQYKEGMKYIGVSNYNESPNGYVDGRISAATFTDECVRTTDDSSQRALKVASSSFEEK